ncbi:MAG: exodeoxyribonuclease VII large subunit [Acidobacteriota bacterium]
MKDSFSQRIDTLFAERRPLTVSEITGQIKLRLEKSFGSLLVQGEIVGFTMHSSGHWYFSLKDERSQIRAVFFKNLNQLQRFKLRNGLQVTARGRLTVYSQKGEYQLQVETVEPVGVGSLQLAFEEQCRRLQAEGLFNLERKRRLPLYPRRIGIVTSPTGAALQDVLRILERRNPGLHIVIAPSRVQGEGAAREIAEGIRQLNQLSERGERSIDVLIVGSGGGAAEDLWAFNEEVVARAIYESAIPVISAVGHETDTTIADLVADLRAATPSAAAELVSSGTAELMIRVDELQTSLLNSMKYLLLRRRSRLERLVGSPGFTATASIARRHLQRIDRLMQGAAESLSARLRRARLSIHNSQLALARVDLRRPIVESNRRLATLDREACQAIEGMLNEQRLRFSTISGELHALSPLAVLGRGYTMTTDASNRLITRARATEPGQRLAVHFADGVVDCDVVNIKLNEE